MAGELREMPVLWGGRLLFLSCRKAEPLTETVAASPSWGSVQTTEPRWSHAAAPEAARVPPGGAVSSEQPRCEDASVPPSRPAASAPQRQESWTRRRADGLSPQRLEAATRVPRGHPQTQTQASLEGSAAPTCLSHCRGLRRPQETCGKLCAPSL